MSINYDDILYAAFFTPFGRHCKTDEVDWGSRLILRGPPGGSKTASLKRLAKRLNVPFFSLKPGTKGDAFWGCTPVPHITENGSTVMTFPVAEWVEEVNRNKYALVGIDELNTSPPVIQSALLGFLQEKEIGSSYVGPHVRLIGASNEAEDAAGGWSLAPAIANRLGHVNFPDPEVNDWCEWLLTEVDYQPQNDKTCHEVEKAVLDNWPKAWAKAAG